MSAALSKALHLLNACAVCSLLHTWTLEVIVISIVIIVVSIICWSSTVCRQNCKGMCALEQGACRPGHEARSQAPARA